MGGKIPAKSNPFYSVNAVNGAAFTVGGEATNVIKVSIQLKDANGNAIAHRAGLRAYLSNDANGDSVCTTKPTGGCAIHTNGVLIKNAGLSIAALTDNSGGSAADGVVAAVAATAAGTAGGSGPTAAQVDTGIAAAVATIVSGVNDAVKEIVTKLNALLAIEKQFVLISEADGTIDVDITDVGTPTFYLVLVMPDGSLAVSGAVTFT